MDTNRKTKYHELLYRQLSYEVQGAVVEVKALDSMPRKMLDQLFDYLRNSKYELGYLINFASPRLYIKRVIYTNDRKGFLRVY